MIDAERNIINRKIEEGDMLQKITPNLWFDGNAKEAVEFYVSVFPNSKVISTSYYPKEGLLDFQKTLPAKSLRLILN